VKKVIDSYIAYQRYIETINPLIAGNHFSCHIDGLFNPSHNFSGLWSPRVHKWLFGITKDTRAAYRCLIVLLHNGKGFVKMATMVTSLNVITSSFISI